ncbi:NAD kinase [Sphingobacterium corticibacter]|uniref:NAD kinase n=1 Tax=Sphingobacterium corticibacter TaxID=2171749 RepID=A0A2T8HMA7_9SPHI|nr:NAD kinase [Sphingobacterium corticibacter]PVH26565.1 NAD kinase [Sphingobacterium corticibacter]
MKTTIAIYGREFNPSVNSYVEELFRFLAARDIDVYIYAPFFAFLKDESYCPPHFKTFNTLKDVAQPIDFMLGLGGDGTMLSAVSLIRDSGIPIVGINFGRLGFLANIAKNDIHQALEEILNGEYTIQSRCVLSVSSPEDELFGDENFALNDITVFKYDTSAMITVQANLDQQLLNDYWADGLIIATPTGSTAYSLSCGGPIIMPGSGNFVITPVSPHNLNVRPIVISAESELDLKIDSRTEKYILSCDSRSKTLPSSTTLRIRKADFEVNLIRLKKDQYFSILREKLLWGLDVRNY